MKRDVFACTGTYVATIAKCHPAADYYNAAAPWLLLHSHGTVGRFSSYRNAREAALDIYPGGRVSAAIVEGNA